MNRLRQCCPLFLTTVPSLPHHSAFRLSPQCLPSLTKEPSLPHSTAFPPLLHNCLFSPSFHCRLLSLPSTNSYPSFHWRLPSFAQLPSLPRSAPLPFLPPRPSASPTSALCTRLIRAQRSKIEFLRSFHISRNKFNKKEKNRLVAHMTWGWNI